MHLNEQFGYDYDLDTEWHEVLAQVMIGSLVLAQVSRCLRLSGEEAASTRDHWFPLHSRFGL